MDNMERVYTLLYKTICTYLIINFKNQMKIFLLHM